MRKVLLCNLDLLRINFVEYGETQNQETKIIRNEFLYILDTFLQQKKVEVIFYSKDLRQLGKAEGYFKEKGKDYKFASREQVNQLLQNEAKSDHVIISGKDVDLQLAVRSRVLLVVPSWIPLEEKAEYYGIIVDTPTQLFKFLQVLNNHNSWYSQTQIDDHTWALSLMDARYKYYASNASEREMMLNFEVLLKQGKSRNYFKVLLYHFLAGITNTDFFDDIELFGMIPSSDCSLNPDMFEFMQQVRYIKGRRLPHNHMICDNLLIRRIPKEKAHETSGYVRMQTGPEAEFDTLCINPEFAQKISNLKSKRRFTVCVFDDYMTYGNSFNAVRNLLNHLGADKIVFVSLGTFVKPFEKWDYEIHGNVFKEGYSYRLINKSQIHHVFTPAAKEEVAALYSIYNDNNI